MLGDLKAAELKLAKVFDCFAFNIFFNFLLLTLISLSLFFRLIVRRQRIALKSKSVSKSRLAKNFNVLVKLKMPHSWAS